MFYFIIYDYKKILKWLISVFICIISYLPWIGFLIIAFKNSIKYWWNDVIPSLKDCYIFIMGNNIFSKFIILLLILAFITYLVKVIIKIILCILKKKRIIKFKELLQKKEINIFLSGMFVVLGTIGLGFCISYIIRPLFIPRFMFVFSGIYYLIISIFIGILLKNKQIFLIVIILVFFIGFNCWTNFYKTEVNNNTITNSNVMYLNYLYNDNDLVVTDVVHLDWTIFDCYFDFKYEKYVGFKESYIGNTTWLLLQKDISYEFLEQLQNNNGNIDFIKRIQINYYIFNIYRVYFD